MIAALLLVLVLVVCATALVIVSLLVGARPMREWCGCGASVVARRGDVLRWRRRHLHGGPEEPAPLVPPTGASTLTETTWQPIGFRPDLT